MLTVMKRRNSGMFRERGVEVGFRREVISCARRLPRPDRRVAWMVAVVIGEGMVGWNWGLDG